MIIITGGARFNPANRDAALKIGTEHSARSRGEPGCVAHSCTIDAEDPNHIVFIELWDDMAAVQRHFAAPESGRFVAELSALALARPEIRIFDAAELPAPF